MKDSFREDQEQLEGISASQQGMTEPEPSGAECLPNERAQQESEALLRTYFENAPDGIYLSDMEGNFLYGNRKSEEITGYSRNELIGKNYFELNLLSERCLVKAVQLFQASLEGKSTGPDELELINKEGRPVPIEINTAVIHRRDQMIILGFVRDISERKRAEEVIKENERKFRTLFDTANDSIFLIKDYLFVHCNRKTLEMFCCTEEDIIDHSPMDFSPHSQPDGLLSLRKAVDKMRMAMQGTPQFFEWQHLKMNGTPFDTEVSLNSLELGGYTYLQAIVRDITDRKQADEALKKSEERYRRLFDLGSDAIFLVDNETGRILEANNASSSLYGYSKEEILQKTILDFSAEPEQTREVIRKELAVVPLRYQKKRDGTIFPVEITITHLMWNGRKSHLAAIRDITARRLAEEEMRREREKLQTLSDSAPFGLVLIDKKGHFNYVNNKFTQLFGYDLSDVPDGRTWFRKAYPDSGYRNGVISTWIEDLSHAMPGEQRPRVFNVTCKDGSQRVIEFIPSILVSGDHLMTCEDITELRRLESHLRRAQKMEAIGTLAGGIAHDFNNILTALMGYASLMQMKMDKDGPLRQYVVQILSAGRKATDLTQGLLAFSRQQPVTLVPMDMNEAIRATEQLLKRLLTEDIELRTSLTQKSTVVMADKSQMDQVLFNLVTNARDAMPKGGTLTIETDIADMDSRFVEVHGFGVPGRYVLINISDTGEGMDEATRGKIFDPFFTTKEIGKGTGLGLATVYGIVKQHDGYITVYSEPNQGTTFHIHLPAVMTKVDEKQDVALPITGGKETILIAEDDKEVRSIMRDALREYGYTILEAVDGEDAVEKFKLHRDIDLVVVDSVMPKRNGREAYEEMRVIDAHIKVLFISGYTRDVVLNKGIEDKKLDFIAKPLSLDMFLQKVREMLDR